MPWFWSSGILAGNSFIPEGRGRLLSGRLVTMGTRPGRVEEAVMKSDAYTVVRTDGLSAIVRQMGPMCLLSGVQTETIL